MLKIRPILMRVDRLFHMASSGLRLVCNRSSQHGKFHGWQAVRYIQSDWFAGYFLQKRWILHQIDVFYLIVCLLLSFKTRVNELKKQV